MALADKEKKCICPTECPNYTGEGVLFCLKGKSTKPPTQGEGCVCVECPVWGDDIRVACGFCIYGSIPPEKKPWWRFW